MRRLGLLAAVVGLSSCVGSIKGGAVPTDPAPDAANESTDPGSSIALPPLPSAAVCRDAPSGRGYLGLAGESLEADRQDLAATADVDRPYRVIDKYANWTLIGDIQKAIGSPSYNDPESQDPGVGASFGVAPTHWYQESEVGTFAVFTTFAYAFKACRRTIDAPAPANRAGWYEYTTLEPTADRSRAYCTRAERAAWLREPSADELQACVDLALDLTQEPDVKNRWAYVCASIVSSVNFLSY